jgi:acetyltransferase-like isoleucine patch superfamily enzyme
VAGHGLNKERVEMQRLRAALNRWRRRLVRGLQFRVLFGERSQGRDLPHTRISPSTCIECEDHLVLADHVYIGHFNLLDASGGLTIDEGVQITSHCAIVTHSSHRSQRLLGRTFATWAGPGERPGWIGGPVRIGAYSFIGPHSVIEANTRLGRGTIVCAGARVRGVFPDFAILDGHPARVVGDSRDGDATLLRENPIFREHHAAWATMPGPDDRDRRQP